MSYIKLDVGAKERAVFEVIGFAIEISVAIKLPWSYDSGGIRGRPAAGW